MSTQHQNRASRAGYHRQATQRSGFIRAHRIGQGTWWEGRSGLLVPLIVAAFATYLLIGIVTMDVAAESEWPGPQFFPSIIMVACYILAVLLTIGYIRHPDPVTAPTDDEQPATASPPDESDGEAAGAFDSPLSSAVAASRTEPGHGDDTTHERDVARASARTDAKHRTHSDFASLAWAVGGFAVFAALIVPAGWVLSAAVLFWCVARSMGSRRPLFDATLALTFSSLVYLAFDTLLGLNLPTGFLGA